MTKAISRIASLLGLAAGILSLVMLAKQGLEFGLVAVLQAMLDFYHLALQILLGWSEPYLKHLLHWMGGWFSLDLKLYPHWRYIFVLLWLYFGADSKTNWTYSKNRAYAVFSLFVGGIVALAVSLYVGVHQFRNPTEDLSAILAAAAGLFVYELLRTFYTATFPIVITSFDIAHSSWRNTFLWAFRNYVLPIAVVSMMAAVFVLLVDGLGTSPTSHPQMLSKTTLAGYAILTLLLSLFWIFRGAWLATYDRFNSETWRGRFFRSGSGRLGFMMLATIVGSILFIALNAGLKFAGF